MKTLFLLRHGKTTANEHNEEDPGNRHFGGQTESELSPTGIIQAEAVGEQLRKLGIRFDEVFTSPLGRTRQTANIVLERSGQRPALKPIVVDALKERGLGLLSGLTADQVRAQFPEFEKHLQRDPRLAFLRETFNQTVVKVLGAESYACVQDRLEQEFVPLLNETGPKSTALVVSHKHTTRAALHLLVHGRDPAKQQDALELEVPNAKPIVLERITTAVPRYAPLEGLPEHWLGTKLVAGLAAYAAEENRAHQGALARLRKGRRMREIQ